MLLKKKGEYYDTLEFQGIVDINNVTACKNFRIVNDQSYAHEIIKSDSKNTLPENCGAIILCDIKFEKTEISGKSFNQWFFLSDKILIHNSTFKNSTSFILAMFYAELSFIGTKFEEDVDFGGAHFHSLTNTETEAAIMFSGTRFEKGVSFAQTQFFSDVSFEHTRFNSPSNDTKEISFWAAKFYKAASFSGASYNNSVTYERSIFNGSLMFYNAVFKERCNLKVNEFGNYVGFAGAEFRSALFINWNKLCGDVNKYPSPEKLIQYRKNGLLTTSRNLFILYRTCKSMSFHIAEDYFLYWYKVYYRENRFKESKKKHDNQEWKDKIKNWKNYFNYRAEKLILDKGTGYFTDYARVLKTIPKTILLFWIMYCIPSLCSIESGGKSLWGSVTGCGSFINYLLNNLYFSAITFSTIGYGDLQPVGFWTKLFASVEGIIVVLLMSTFLVVLTRKYIR